jgi:hypothetical protein
MKLIDLFEAESTWKPVVGWPGYEVSRSGKVRSAKTKKLLAQEEHFGNDKKNPYMRVHLHANNVSKHVRVSRIVAFAFLGSPKAADMEVDHIDHNTRNNSVKNLQWLTPNQNKTKRNIQRNKALDNSRNTQLSAQV